LERNSKTVLFYFIYLSSVYNQCIIFIAQRDVTDLYLDIVMSYLRSFIYVIDLVITYHLSTDPEVVEVNEFNYSLNWNGIIIFSKRQEF
jgi:uncharacterized membrane protein